MFTVTFKNIQNLDHVMELTDDDTRYEATIYIKYDREFEKYKDVIKIKKVNLHTLFNRFLNTMHKLKHHVCVDYDPKMNYIINFNDKSIELRNIIIENYKDIEIWIPELKLIPFDVHRIQNGVCFATNTETNIEILYLALKNKFAEYKFYVYKLSDDLKEIEQRIIDQELLCDSMQ